MTIQILRETDQHLVLHLEDGRVDTVINDDYTKLKYGKSYEGNRIFYKFEDGIEFRACDDCSSVSVCY